MMTLLPCMKIYSDEDPYYKLDLESEDGPGVPQKAD
jgi:hypothetical protein